MISEKPAPQVQVLPLRHDAAYRAPGEVGIFPMPVKLLPVKVGLLPVA